MNTMQDKNDILIIKGKGKFPKLSSYLLFILYINVEKLEMVKFMSVVNSDSDLYQIPLKTDFNEIMKKIQKSETKTNLEENLSNLLSDKFEESISISNVEKIINMVTLKKFLLVEDIIIKSVLDILKTDKVDLQIETEFIKFNMFEELKVREVVGKFPFSRKIDILKKYIGNDTPLAEKIIREDLDDIAIIKLKFTKVNSYYGVALIFYSLSIKNFIRMVIKTDKRDIFDEIDITTSLVKCFNRINSMIDHRAANKVEAEIEEKIMNVFAQVFAIFKKKDGSKLDSDLAEFFFNTVGFTEITEIDVDYMNPLILDSLVGLKNDKKEEPVKEDQKKEKSQKFVGLKLLNVELIVSPTKGIKISSLKVGDKIMAKINKFSPRGLNVIKKLKLDNKGKVKPVPCSVYSIEYDKDEGYAIVLKIAKDLYGKAYESEDVKISADDSLMEEENLKIVKKRMLTIIAITAVAIILMILYIIFIKLY